MARKHVKLQFIANDHVRKATFKKIMKGLWKDLTEINTLWGAEACAIVYSPDYPQLYVWPSPQGVQRSLAKSNQMPNQSKKMMNRETFRKLKVKKAKEHLRKLKKDNKKKEMTLLKLQRINRKMKALKKVQTAKSQTPMLADTAPSGAIWNEEKAPNDHRSGLEMIMEAVQKHHGFVDLDNGSEDETSPLGDVNHKNGI